MLLSKNESERIRVFVNGLSYRVFEVFQQARIVIQKAHEFITFRDLVKCIVALRITEVPRHVRRQLANDDFHIFRHEWQQFGTERRVVGSGAFGSVQYDSPFDL